MSRSVPEWVGDNDDTAIPARVRVRVFEAKRGLCHRCGKLIRAGERWVLEHVIALINWLKTGEQPHGNREGNLDLTCCNCLPVKNGEDVAEKSAVYQDRKRHVLHSEGLGRGSSWRRPVRATQPSDKCRRCGEMAEDCVCPPPLERKSAFASARRP